MRFQGNLKKERSRRAAAFVTAKDPAVLRFVKSLAGMVSDNPVQAVDYNMQVAMVVHRAHTLSTGSATW